MDTPRVAAVRVIPPYSLEVTFRDGFKRVHDLTALVHQHGTVFEPLSDPEMFAQVFIYPEWSTVAWPNGADLAPEWLYEPDEEKYWGKTSVG